MALTLEQAAQFCHESKRIYQGLNGDPVDPSWEELSDLEKEMELKAVKHQLQFSPEVTSAATKHIAWLKEMQAAGWSYGARYREDQKKHPDMVNFDDLKEGTRLSGYLFKMNLDGIRASIVQSSDKQKIPEPARANANENASIPE